jgi:hypothetical protein
MAWSHRATIGLIVGLLIPFGFLVFWLFWKLLMPHDTEVFHLRSRRADLEAQLRGDCSARDRQRDKRASARVRASLEAQRERNKEFDGKGKGDGNISVEVAL